MLELQNHAIAQARIYVGDDGHHVTVETVGEKATWAVVAGIHGDEDGNIPFLEKALRSRATLLPHVYGEYARILWANPDALRRHTRTDSRGADLNRQFRVTRPIKHPQAQLLARAITDLPHAHTVFSIHEDMEYDHYFYFYNTSKKSAVSERDGWFTDLRHQFLTTVKRQGFRLFSGRDDPTLQYKVKDGFCDAPATGPFDKTFEMYAARRGIHPSIKRVVLFEIPGQAPVEKKRDLIWMIARHFIEPYVATMNKLS